MHGSRGLRPSSIQVGFLRNGTTSDSHSLPLKGLLTFELQQGKVSEYGSSLKRSSERSDVVEAPASFGFFGGQQQLNMSQHPGQSQPRFRQQQGFDDMQLWQQHLMYKQLQEIQKQQQLQQLEHGRPQSLHTQLPQVARQAVIDQFPGVLNGMPVSDSSNYMWSSEHAGGELKTPSSSHMLLAEGMSMAQCSGSSMHGISNELIFLHDQDQLMQPLGFVPQLDQSFNGTPVSHMRGSSIYLSQFQGMSHDCIDALIKAGGNQAEKSSIQSSALNCFQSDHFIVPEQGCSQDSVLIAKQAFQGRGSFVIAPVQGLNIGATSGNYWQAEHVSCNLQAQEFQGRKEENDWSGNLEEEAVMQIERSCGGTSLDPTEERLMLGTVDDGNCASSFGSSIINSTGFLHDKPLENNDHFGAFPSIQCGIWSALMQEAVEASSSNVGLHEEWSGLSFQKTELLSGNRSAALSDNGKHQMMWDDSNQQSASSMTSRPFLLFNDADASSNCHTAPSFPHAARFAYGLNERVSTDASHDSIQQPSKEASEEHLDQSDQQKQFVGTTFQAQMHLDNVSNGVQEGQMYEQSVNFVQSTGMELNLQNMQVLVDQQKLPLPNINSQHSNKPNGWNINGSLSPDKLKAHDNNVTNQDATLHVEKNYDSNIWKVGRNQAAVSFPNFSGGLQPVRSDSGSPRVGDFAAITTPSTLTFNQEINHQVLNRHQGDYGKHVAVDSSVKYEGDKNFTKYQNQLSRGQHAWDSSLNNTDQGSSETYNDKQENSLPEEVSNEGYDFRQSHRTLHADPRGCAGENLAGNEHRLLVGNGQKLSGQSSWKFLGLQSDRSYSQSTPHLVVQALKNQEQAGHFVGYSAVHMGKGHLIGTQRSAKGTEEIQYKGPIPGHDSALSSFDGSDACFSENRSAGLSSQYMPDLLHKVEQSRERNSISCFSYSEHRARSEIPESAASDGCAHLQHSQSSALKGFGLKLAPPSQSQPLSSHSLSSQTSLQSLNDCDSKVLDPGAGDKDQMRLISTTKIPSIPLHETSEGVNLDDESSISGWASNSSIYENSLAPSSLPYAWNKDIFNADELATMNYSARPFGSQADVDGHSKHTSHPNMTHDSRGGALADQSAQVSLPSMDGRVSSFGLVPSAGTCAPIASQVYSLDSGHSQLINASIHVINSGQPFSLVETKSVDQHSATAGFSQQGGFSTMLHNGWPSVSSNQRLSGAQPQKTGPIVNQSTSPLPSVRVTNSCAMQMTVDDSKRRGGSAPCEFVASSIDSPQQKSPDKVDVAPMKGSTSHGQELVRKHLSDGNSAVSIPSLVCLHRQDRNQAKHGEDLNFASLYHDKGASERTLKSLDAHTRKYSLPEQMQVKGVEPDPSKHVGKRLKGADLESDAKQMGWTGGQRFIFGQNPVLKELGASIQRSSFPSDVKMLSFSLKENEDKSTSTCSQITGKDVPSQDLLASMQHDMQNHAKSPIKNSKPTGNEQPWISPQMAPSWFGQYRTYKNGQILETHDGLSNSQRTAKGATCFFAKVSESMHNSTLVEQRFNAGKFGSLQQNTSSTIIATIEDSPSHSLPPDAIDGNMILMPKKRKSATPELLPWHKEVIQGSRRLQTISMAGLDWAQAANRLIEKIGDEFEIMEDCSSTIRLRRRLVLTTRLMQQLIPSVPARFLNADATSSYESLAYFIAKLALGNACSLLSCSGNDSHMLLNNRKMRPEELKSSDKAGDFFFSEVMGNFIGRLEELESKLLRLEKRSSILDLRVECRDLERCSIINRSAKFHGWAQTDRVGSSLTSENAPRRELHRRKVTAFAMPGNFPEGGLCFSL